MGCLLSKPAVDDCTVAMKYAAELSVYYDEACRLEPELQSLGPILRRSTSRVISAVLADADALGFLSLNSLREAADGLADVGHSALATILNLKDEISSNPDLLFFVKEYFRNNVDVLKFFVALRGSIQRARDTEAIVHDAIDHFNKGEYSASLEKLREFKEAGDLLTASFVEEFRSVCEQQQAMFAALLAKKGELDKKLGSMKAWHKLWNIIYTVAFSAALICSVVLAAVSVPPAAPAIAVAVSAALPPLWKWMESMWNGHEGALEGPMGTVTKLSGGTFFALQELDSIRRVVERLEGHVGPLLKDAGFANREEEEEEGVALRLAVEDIKVRLGEFVNSLEDLELKVDLYRADLRQVTAAILKAVTNEL